MNGRSSVGFSRRAGLAVALASVALAPPQASSAAVMMIRGMAGGGLVKLEHGEANVSLIVTQSTFPDQRQVVVGSILWVEAGTQLSLASIDVTGYEKLADQERGRRVRGTILVDDQAEFPFVLDVVDVGPPGSGQDTITLTVGDDLPDVAGGTPRAGTPAAASGTFRYQASGTLVTGDFQDVTHAIAIG